MDIAIATVIAFGIMGAMFWYIGLKQQRNFRIFFMTLGFYMFIALFLTMPTFSTGYVVPINITNTPYYSQSAINSLTGTFSGIGEGLVGAWTLYIGLELIYFFKELINIRKLKRGK